MKKYKIIVGGQILLMTKDQIEGLDTKEMTSMEGMFSLTPDFDGDLSLWDVSNVKCMNSMFENCVNFLDNETIKKWNLC